MLDVGVMCEHALANICTDICKHVYAGSRAMGRVLLRRSAFYHVLHMRAVE